MFLDLVEEDVDVKRGHCGLHMQCFDGSGLSKNPTINSIDNHAVDCNLLKQ